MIFDRTLGIALSGGGIKAYSQIGVLKRLKENDIDFSGFSGTSMGSIIATFAAAGISCDEIEERLLRVESEIVKRKLLNPSNAQVFPLITQSITGLINPKEFRNLLEIELKDLNIKKMSDIKLPLVIVSADLKSGALVYFTNRPKAFKSSKFEKIFGDADIIDALQASCSFPMVFENMIYKDTQLVDGGVLMNLPVKPLRQLGFDRIFSISMEKLEPFKESKKATDIAMRIFDMSSSDATRNSIAMSDYNINVFHKSIGIFSFGKGKQAIDLGYKTASEVFQELEDIKIDLRRFRI